MKENKHDHDKHIKSKKYILVVVIGLFCAVNGESYRLISQPVKWFVALDESL